MLVLFETPAGFALFKVLDEGKLDKVEDLWKVFETADSARKIVKLKAFSKFENTAEALGAATYLVESKPTKSLRKFLKEQCQGETLAIADSKLGNVIKEKLKIDCVHNNMVMELMRGLRAQLSELITGLAGQDLAPMSLGLSHSLSRYKLKFSPDKVDTMIIQAIGLLDDLDKELNTYAMRVREWYGWHFPELGKIVQDNIQYAKAVKLMGSRSNASSLDFSEILPEEVEAELKEAAVISMGTEVSDQDMVNIKALCDQVISLSEYRAQLSDYLRSRMNAIAPNLTVLVGELVGARLIAHAGSLINLAKHPASTVQILGAEKALFRALKTKQQTPKYGLIYHASLIGQAAPKLKGKISRSLAAKSALSVRYDALGDSQDASIGLESRAKMEARLRQLEGRVLGRISAGGKGKPKIEAYDKDRKQGNPNLHSAAKTYNPAADSTLVKKKPDERLEDDLGAKKKMKHEQTEAEAEAEPTGIDQAVEKSVKKKKDKRKEQELIQMSLTPEAETVNFEVTEKPVKKKKKVKEEIEEVDEAMPLPTIVEAVVEPQKKKKKKDKKTKERDTKTFEQVKSEDERVTEGATGTELQQEDARLKSAKKKRKLESQKQFAEIPEKMEKKKKKKERREAES